MKVRFLQDISVETDNPPLHFKKDDVVDLNDRSAQRWVRRGLAEQLTYDVKLEPKAEPVVPNDPKPKAKSKKK